MAEYSKIKLDIPDDFMALLKPRVHMCRADGCKHNRAHMWQQSLECNLREIQIEPDGRCFFYEERQPTAE